MRHLVAAAPARPARRRRAGGLLAAAGAVALLGAGCGSGASGTASGGPTTGRPAGGAPAGGAPSLLSSATSAAGSATSVQFADVTSSGGGSASLVGGIGVHEAFETLRNGVSTLTVELVGGMVYVRGTAGALIGPLGLAAPQASSAAGKWIAVKPGDPPYAALVKSLSLSSELNLYVPIEPGLSSGRPVTVHGRRAIPVSGTPPSAASSGATGTATLLVAPARPHLPVGAALRLRRGAQQVSKVAVFSRWGQPVVVTAPAGAVPFGSIAPG